MGLKHVSYKGRLRELKRLKEVDEAFFKQLEEA